MKIVHVYAKNIQMFADAVEGTECRLNASHDLNYLIASLQQFNARDVLGLVIFANPLTKKCLTLIRKFDDLFVFRRLPVVIISDQASALRDAGYFRVRHSTVYVVNSEDNSISDIELNAIFTTLIASTDEIYDLSVIPAERKIKEFARTHGDIEDKRMSAQLIDLLRRIGRGASDESDIKRQWPGEGPEAGEAGFYQKVST